MPLYEFACRHCHQESEILIRGSEQPACPACGSVELEKQFSVPAAHTRGAVDLPVCRPAPAGGCGAPWCGTGGCQGGM